MVKNFLSKTKIKKFRQINTLLMPELIFLNYEDNMNILI